MEKYGIAYISPKYSASDFINLRLKLNSNENDWLKAIEMFEDRINKRYLTPIDKLLENEEKIEENGFAAMAINCLLVDTFYQFRDPDNVQIIDYRRERLRRSNKTVYTEFLINNFPNTFDEDTALYFYTDIRCGILHSAQTKNGSMLTFGNEYTIELFDMDKIKVDVKNFSMLLRSYYDNYLSKLKQGNKDLRRQFLQQMKQICRTVVIR